MYLPDLLIFSRIFSTRENILRLNSTPIFLLHLFFTRKLFMHMKIFYIFKNYLWSYFIQRSFANVVSGSVGERQGLLYGSTDERGRWWWSYCCWSKITQWNSSKTYFTRGYLYQTTTRYDASAYLRLNTILHEITYKYYLLSVDLIYILLNSPHIAVLLHKILQNDERRKDSSHISLPVLFWWHRPIPVVALESVSRIFWYNPCSF